MTDQSAPDPRLYLFDTLGDWFTFRQIVNIADDNAKEQGSDDDHHVEDEHSSDQGYR